MEGIKQATDIVQSSTLPSLCGDPKDANHITFSFTLARFMWSCIREMYSCDWNPTSFGDFYSLMQGVPGQSRGVLALDLHHYSMLGSLEHQE